MRVDMSRKGLLLWLVVLFLVLGCNALFTSPTASDDLLAAYGINRAEAIVLVGSQPETLDPALTRSGADGPLGSIFTGLVSLDTDLQVQPELAAGWEVSPDGTLYRFFLRRNALFHDGRPVTAADVIFSWERATDPVTGSDTASTYLGDIVGVSEKLAGQAATISGLQAVDDYTLEARIDAPKVYFLSKLTYPVAFVVDWNNVTEPNWQYQPNGTGPFILQEWQDDQVLILAGNDHYYLGPPAVKHVVYQMGAGIPLSLYEKDEVDLVGIGGSNLDRAQDPNDPLAADLRIGVAMCTSFIGFNNRLPPFDDPLVRQAFSFAIDKERLIEGVYRGNVLAATGILPPGMPGFQNSLEAYPFDPQRARALLAQAGYGDPADFPEATYTTAGYGGVGSLVTAVITMWQENLGIAVEPVLLEPFNYYDELYAGNTGHIFGFGWCADYPDPENFLDVLFHSTSTQNLAGYHNPTVDDLLEQARIEVDVARRLALYAEIERMIVSEAPVVLTVHGLSALLVKPRLQGYVFTPMGVPQWHRLSLASGD
jgi:oligopeptide transport system substrate-binding protein